MSSKPASPKELWLTQREAQGAATSDEELQKVDDPVAELKKMGDKLAIIVPYEWLWPDNYAPFKNKLHKRFYDADLLAEHLEAAGYKSHAIRVLEFASWTFLTAECVRILNSAERRRKRRESLHDRSERTVEVEQHPARVVPDNAGQEGAD